jgi:hypothetical protein
VEVAIHHILTNRDFSRKVQTMKTMIELPDKLMDEVKTLANREHREVGEVVAELVRAGLDNRTQPLSEEDQVSAEQWILDWLALADQLMMDAPSGPSARDLLEEERNRLERH